MTWIRLAFAMAQAGRISHPLKLLARASGNGLTNFEARKGRRLLQASPPATVIAEDEPACSRDLERLFVSLDVIMTICVRKKIRTGRPHGVLRSYTKSVHLVCVSRKMCDSGTFRGLPRRICSTWKARRVKEQIGYSSQGSSSKVSLLSVPDGNNSGTWHLRSMGLAAAEPRYLSGRHPEYLEHRGLKILNNRALRATARWMSRNLKASYRAIENWTT